MKRGIFVIIIILILIIAGFVVFEIFSKKKTKPIFSEKIGFVEAEDEKENKNITETITKTQEYKTFSQRCEGLGGDVIISGNVLNCYEVAQDSKKSCSDDVECRYNCDFSLAINSGVCSLTKTDKDLEKGTYNYEYNCNEEKPGKCSEIPLDRKWELQENRLTESGYKEFPVEKEEFSPV